MQRGRAPVQMDISWTGCEECCSGNIGCNDIMGGSSLGDWICMILCGDD